MQNLNTTAMEGGSVENVGTIFNHYIHVDNRINRMQNLNTTAMYGGSVDNVGTLFNHYVHVDNRIHTVIHRQVPYYYAAT